MKKVITIALIFLSGACYAQQDIKIAPVGLYYYPVQSHYDSIPVPVVLDSVRVVFDKNGNLIRKQYYSIKLIKEREVKNEKSFINKD